MIAGYDLSVGFLFTSRQTLIASYVLLIGICIHKIKIRWEDLFSIYAEKGIHSIELASEIF